MRGEGEKKIGGSNAADGVDRGCSAEAKAAIALACTRCGLTLKRAMLMALLRDGGATTSVNPLECDGLEHDFQPRRTA